MRSLTGCGRGGGDDYQGFGPEFLVACRLEPRDVVGVVATELNGHPVGVAIEAVQHLPGGGISGAQILLTPSDARRFAAHILNAADRCDGTSPLCFYERPAGDQ